MSVFFLPFFMFALVMIAISIWMVYAVARFFFGSFRAISRWATVPPFPSTRPTVLPTGRRCGAPNCCAVNPPEARFCRQCGRSMTNGAVRMSRVAMF